MQTFLNSKVSTKTLLLILIVLSLHLFFRFYNAHSTLGYGHDEDLSGWIVKDIIIDHHFRLIGQETSIDSVFIGPLFYYLEAIYFYVFNMDPIGGLFLTVTISILTFFSIYYVFKKFFGNSVAILGILLYAASKALAGHDQWIVPTQPTLLWTTWFLYALFGLIEERNPKIFLLLGILLGLIWYIHVAFIPLLILIPLVILLSKKQQSLKNFLLNRYSLLGIMIILIFMLPFFLFEIRHNFMQTQGLIRSLSQERNAVSGFDRAFKVYDGVSWSFLNIIHEVRTTNAGQTRIIQAIALLVFVLMLILNKNKLGKKTWIIYGWLGIVIISQLISKRPISEYYFTNLTILEILTIAVFLNHLKRTALSVGFLFLLIGVFIFFNLKSLINQPGDQEGYLERKKLISFIKEDATANGYPCIAINYMTSPGKNAGFRYFFWLNGLKLISPANDVAVYSILNPAAMSEGEIAGRFGSMGVILPNKPVIDKTACDKPERQLLPLWGFNN